MDDNFLARLRNIFRGEQVPMAPQPSVVRVAEDEDVYIDNQQPSGFLPELRQTAQNLWDADVALKENIFGGIKDAAANAVRAIDPPLARTLGIDPPLPAEGETTEVPPMGSNPAENPDQMGMPGLPVPPVPEEDQIGVPPMAEDGQMGMPDAPEAPVPPMQEDLLGQLKAWRETTEEGSPDRAIADRRIAQLEEEMRRVEETGKSLTDVRKDIDKDRQRINKTYDLRFADFLPNEEELPTPTLEEAKTITEDVDKGVADLSTKDENGNPTGNPPPVVDPDGNERVVTPEQVKEVATKDSGFGKAMNWIEKTFGITGQDLARFALLYVGSRVAGYDHQGSMSWAFESAAKDFLDRRKISASLAESGKYTPESIEKYRKTGNTSVLKKVAEEGKGIKYDYTRTKFKKGTNELVYEATLANGSKAWMDTNGKPYIGEVEDTSRRTGIDETRPDRVKRTAEIAEEIVGRQNEKAPWYTGSITADAGIIQDRLDWWSETQGVSIDSGARDAVIRNAYLQAERWAAATAKTKNGGQVSDISTFIDAQMMYMSSENPWAQQLRKNGEELNPKDIAHLTNSIMEFALTDPEFDPTKVERGAMLNTFMEYAWEAYSKLPPEQKKKFEGRDGFYTFLITNFGTKKER